jgi:hypothetical protein
MDCEVWPFDHVLPVALDEVKVTEPPEQMVVDPFVVIVGALGAEEIVTLVAAEVELHAPLTIVTE